MPAVLIKEDYRRRSKLQRPLILVKSPSNKHQLTIEPSRYRFRKYTNIPLGVINPEQFSSLDAKARRGQLPEHGEFQPGDEKFMEVRGEACSALGIVPNVKYTEADRARLPDHLVNPFLYVQRLFDRGDPNQQMKHPDVFIYFEELRNSQRDNKNIRNFDYIKVLKAMSKREKDEFYSRCIEMSQFYIDFFRKFVRALRERGLLDPSEEISHRKPKLPKDYIINLAGDRVITADLMITESDFYWLMKQLGYPERNIDDDVRRFFSNVVLGDSPVDMLIPPVTKMKDKISLRAFLFNVSKYLKGKIKLKDIFSKNAAKQRNVEIKNSLAPFLSDVWPCFKDVLKMLRQRTPVDPMIDKYIRLKRIYAKHLQSDILKYILLGVSEISTTYAHDINKSKQQFEILNTFLRGFYRQLKGDEFTLEQVIDYLLSIQASNQQAQQIISFIKKVLKYYGRPISQPPPSKYLTSPNGDAQQTLTRRQVDDFVRQYTEKKNLEWIDFRELLSRLKDFQVQAISKLKLNHRQSWEWNMVAEWLLRRLKELDTQILQILDDSLKSLGIGVGKVLTFEKFLSEQYIKLINPEVEQHEDQHMSQSDEEDAQIDQAMAAFKVAAQNLIVTVAEKPKPVTQSAQEFLDSSSVQRVPIKENVSITSAATNEEEDLDQKIRNAIILQGKCESTFQDIFSIF